MYVCRERTKRLRLGTRSCAECRRRRVRCVFLPGNSTCEACILHKNSCEPQQPGGAEQRKLPSNGEAVLQRRLEELEVMVRNMPSGSKPRPQPSFATGGSTRPKGSPTFETVLTDSCFDPMQAPEHNDRETAISSSPAPLINMLKSAMRIDAVESQPSTVPLITSEMNMKDIMSAIRPLCPQRTVLRAICEITSPYWSAWPAYYYGDKSTEKIQPGTAEDTSSRIFEALSASQPIAAAKAMVWLALCMQQLPLVLDERLLQLPAQCKTLTETYMRAASKLLEPVTVSERSIEEVECLLFKAKLYLNEGRLRKSWLSLRNAMSISLVLGLHRLDLKASERQKYVWHQTWNLDLTLSMVLGFPGSMSIGHPSLALELAPTGYISEIGYAMSKLTYDIIQRDQQGQIDDYATTMRLDQDWEACQALLSSGSLNDQNSNDESFTDVYHRQVAIMSLLNLQKMIHMPFMLKGRTNSKYSHSRVSATNSARQMVSAYCLLRENKATERTICELMDFQAFCAGVILIIGSLFEGSTCDIDEQRRDWSYIETLTTALKRTSNMADCLIAAQAVRVLDILTKAYHRDGATPTRYEATIPCFGKVYLTCKRQSQPESTPSTPSDQPPTTSPYLSDVELDVNFFDFINLPAFDMESDLRTDWTTILEQ